MGTAQTERECERIGRRVGTAEINSEVNMWNSAGFSKKTAANWTCQIEKGYFQKRCSRKTVKAISSNHDLVMRKKFVVGKICILTRRGPEKEQKIGSVNSLLRKN